VAGASLAATGAGAVLPAKAQAQVPAAGEIKGVCLFVPSLGREFKPHDVTTVRGV